MVSSVQQRARTLTTTEGSVARYGAMRGPAVASWCAMSGSGSVSESSELVLYTARQSTASALSMLSLPALPMPQCTGTICALETSLPRDSA